MNPATGRPYGMEFPVVSIRDFLFARYALEGVEIEHSIVLPGAQIRYPGRRLESSLVGEGAQIGRDYSLPSALRLRVGPNAEIQLS